MKMDIELQNNKECFVLLWRLLKRTRSFLRVHHKRFCVREVLKLWFEGEATDDFIWEVCNGCGLEGWSELPSLKYQPRTHRELLKAILELKLADRPGRVNLKALDAAYSVVYPTSTPMNVGKKKPHPQPLSQRRGEENVC